MNRRENIKYLFFGGVSASLLCNYASGQARQLIYRPFEEKDFSASNWHKMPDMTWAGPIYWGNRLQDWQIKNGILECSFHGPDRTLHNLIMQLGNSRNSFNSRVYLRISDSVNSSRKNKLGFLLGAKNWNHDYRASAVHGKGLKVGINGLGNLFIGEEEFTDTRLERAQLAKGIILEIIGEPLGAKYNLHISVFDSVGEKLSKSEKSDIEPDDLIGNIALLSDVGKFVGDEKNKDQWVCTYDRWELKGEKFDVNIAQSYGPICFTQYTTQKKLVKLTAQLSPVPLPAKVRFEINTGKGWKQLCTSIVEYPSYTAHFRFEDWAFKKSIPFRVSYDFHYTDGSKERFYWEGTVAEEPISKESLKVLVCSCNYDLGFPDQDIVEYASMHNPGLVMFLGDQFYEINGGFGFQKAPLEKAYLDYHRKWYMFGWSYRELFRHIPTINLPDDHDVFQGNLFGANGRPIPKTSLGGLNRDYGGYMMPPEWVNLVMTTQTSHMPDPYDAEPIEQGIHVFYSNWNYAGISFGIIEDRKFKSGPAAILPKEAKVRDAFSQNKDFDIKDRGFPKAKLLGERQIEFLKEWVEEWADEVHFKVLVSAVPFHALQTLPNGAESNGTQQKLYVPEEGEYIKGDIPVADMDSGGWPQSKRNEILRIIRKCYAFHLAGDQHLPSITQYGVENYQDAGYVFAVPALANSWPRRWWPPIKDDNKNIPGQPAYMGNHEDAFGNKMHVRAVANPLKRGMMPNKLFDRSTGYGVVTFNKKSREVKMECWPRYKNPKTQPQGQYNGWPVTINQLENFTPLNPYFLPTINVHGIVDPLIKVLDERNEVQVVLKVKGQDFQPMVKISGLYTVVVKDTASNNLKKIKKVGARLGLNDERLKVSFV